MVEWTDAKKRDQYTKVCEALGLIDYPDGRAPYLAYPSEVIAAIRRLVDEEVSGWNELTEGCRMPEMQGIVLVTVEVDDDEPWAYTTTGAYWYGDAGSYFATDRDEVFFAVEGYRIKRDRDEPGKRLTAWTPAPKPFVKGQP